MKKFYVFSFLYAIYNLFTEVLIYCSCVSWRYKLYYFVPIRLHAFLPIVSILIVLVVGFGGRYGFVEISIVVINLLYIICFIYTFVNG